ncbi:MAG: hypothetical protein AMXMBFR83_31740 [Phycisphaerae bacterium]
MKTDRDALSPDVHRRVAIAEYSGGLSRSLTLPLTIARDIHLVRGGEADDDAIALLKPRVNAFLRGEIQLHELVGFAYDFGELRGFICGWHRAEEARQGLSARLGEEAEATLRGAPYAYRVAALLLDGKTYDDIGECLGIGPETVRFHVKRAAEVLGYPGVPDLKRALGVPLRPGRRRSTTA